MFLENGYRSAMYDAV